MNVARLLYPVKVLGPGQRLGLWLCGCNHRCPGCCNSELWTPRPDYEITVDNLVRLVNKVGAEHTIDGFTISGGEPFDQPEDLVSLLERLVGLNPDILVYSGYTLAELKASLNPAVDAALARAAVLIDGRYEQTRNSGKLLRGSDNQRIHILKAEYKAVYRHYLQTAPKAVQNFAGTGGVIAAGIHGHKAYAQLKQKLQTWESLI